MMRIPTILFWLFPKQFLSRLPKDFDLGRFSEEEYEWERDPLFGLADHAKSPNFLIKRKRGDCVDYARLAASYLYYEREKEIELYALFDAWPPMGHMVVVSEPYIYSSGDIMYKTFEEYKEESRYDVHFSKKIR